MIIKFNEMYDVKGDRFIDGFYAIMIKERHFNDYSCDLYEMVYDNDDEDGHLECTHEGSLLTKYEVCHYLGCKSFTIEGEGEDEEDE